MTQIKMTKAAAESRIDVLRQQYNEIESEMVNLALKFNIDLYLEGKGNLLLEDSDYGYKGRGDWYTSTDSCS